MQKKKIKLITFRLNDKINFKKKKNNNFFVGDWCNLDNDYLQKKKKNNLFIYEPNNYKRKTADTLVMRKLYKKLLKSYSKNLNLFHNKKYTTKVWEILIGRWLYTYIIDVYTRWLIIEKIKKNYFLEKFYKLKFGNINFIPTNTLNARMMVREFNQYYSHYIFSNILEFSNYKKKNIIEIDLQKSHVNKELNSSKIEENVYGVFSKCLKQNILFYKSSLDRKIIESFFKHFLFINYPLKIRSFNFSQKHDLNMRDRFFEKLNSIGKVSNIEKFLIEFSYNTFPMAFLENFSEIKRVASKINWPKKPNYIFTSYGHYNDEIFKNYCAQKVHSGCKLFIFQHGAGGIFSDKEFFAIRSDLDIANRYLGWGTNKKKNIKPFFYTKKVLTEKKYNFSKKKKILILLYQLNETVVFPPNGFLTRDKINKKMFENFYTFAKMINKKVLSKFNIKILDDVHSRIYSFKKSIKKSFPKVKFLNKKKIFNNILSNHNITIHFRISTVFFESIANNIPSILIYDKHTNIKHDSNFLKIVKTMLNCKLAFSNVNEASEFLNKDYQTIEKWWNSKNIQTLRIKLNKKFCRNFDKNHDDFKKFLHNQ